MPFVGFRCGAGGGRLKSVHDWGLSLAALLGHRILGLLLSAQVYQQKRAYLDCVLRMLVNSAFSFFNPLMRMGSFFYLKISCGAKHYFRHS